MNKYDLGLKRIDELEKCKEKFKDLNEIVEEIDDKMTSLGGSFKIPKVQEMIQNLIDEFSGVEFMSKETYCFYFNSLKRFDTIAEELDKLYYKIGNDFGKFSLFEYICLGIDLLQIATYDSLICPDYPCTSELIYSGEFGYYLPDSDEEIKIDTPEKCWEYLKEDYDALDD